MITLEQITEVLESRDDGITDVRAAPQGYAFCHLANAIDPQRPYTLVVHPITDKGVLRVRILSIAKVRADSRVPEGLARANMALTCGCAAIDPDGEATFQINHLCSGHGDYDPPRELLDRLLDEAVAAVRKLERIILVGAMVDSGIPQHRAREIMEAVLPPGNDGRAAEDEQTL